MKPRFVRMPWQTTDNYTDCGIFLMRHMETFKGDIKNWNTDLTEEGVRLVSYFTYLYTALHFSDIADIL